ATDVPSGFDQLKKDEVRANQGFKVHLIGPGESLNTLKAIEEAITEKASRYEFVNDQLVRVYVGTVKKFDAEKGYGFIARDNTSIDTFAHHSAIQPDYRLLEQGQLVEFNITQGRKGPQAA